MEAKQRGISRCRIGKGGRPGDRLAITILQEAAKLQKVAIASRHQPPGFSSLAMAKAVDPATSCH